MTEKASRQNPNSLARPELEAISSLVDKSFKPGSSLSFGVPEGTVNITLDASGDWTIMVGLASRSERISTVSYVLERLGYFRATENDGTVYFIWTSALEDLVDGRSLAEGTLFETLKALERNDSKHYIC